MDLLRFKGVALTNDLPIDAAKLMVNIDADFKAGVPFIFVEPDGKTFHTYELNIDADSPNKGKRVQNTYLLQEDRTQIVNVEAKANTDVSIITDLETKFDKKINELSNKIDSLMTKKIQDWDVVDAKN
jgi:hypothetical protein